MSDEQADVMTGRVARFVDLQPIPKGYLDTAIPGHRRTVFNVIGVGVTEDTSYAPAIEKAEFFNITYVEAEPGNGAALHSHDTVEVFIPITGRWAVYWGDQGEHQVELVHLDCISVPSGVMRGFRNVGPETARMIAIQGGTDSGRVTWPQSVIDQARAHGHQHDEHGNLPSTGSGGR